MENEERFKKVRVGLKIYGLLDDEKAREYITELFSSLPDEDYKILWDDRKITFVITGEENMIYDVYPSKNISNESECGWMITISKFDKKSKKRKCATERNQVPTRRPTREPIYANSRKRRRIQKENAPNTQMFGKSGF